MRSTPNYFFIISISSLLQTALQQWKGFLAVREQKAPTLKSVFSIKKKEKKKKKSPPYNQPVCRDRIQFVCTIFLIITVFFTCSEPFSVLACFEQHLVCTNTKFVLQLILSVQFKAHQQQNSCFPLWLCGSDKFWINHSRTRKSLLLISTTAS